MIHVREATVDDVDALVGLETKLFEEDAGVHDTFVDLSWPGRAGRDNFLGLLAEAGQLVLIATQDDSAIGHLVGYASAASPTRQPVTFATLRSMYVLADHRSGGVGEMLAERFLAWARAQGCVEAHVSSYAANERAQAFYERLGFAARSISWVTAL